MVRCQRFAVQHRILLDTLPVAPESVRIQPTVAFRLEEYSSTLVLSDSVHQQLGDSVTICFRSLSSDFFQPIFIHDKAKLAKGSVISQPHIASNMLPREELVDFGKMESYGALSRGITFGNRQNVFVNSALNLHLEGELTDKLKLQASITDQNIPYQPEGNTQQIRDFDNVLIRMYSDAFDLRAGDIVLQNPIPESYFLKYYKNVQGMGAVYQYRLGSDWTAISRATGALAKGQFASAVITPREGVQGPYKLRGSNGERFIVVLANSEKVFVDGVLLRRGFDLDYVIDYNLGEITFSPSIPITQFSRIRVDYEFADQYYARSNVSASQELRSGRAFAYSHLYRERDNPSATLGFNLSETDLDRLSTAGLTGGQAWIDGADSVGYGENGIFYALTDTLDDQGQTVQIYVVSNDPSRAFYQVSFSEVPQGEGDYMQSTLTSNGRTYTWVSPQNGVKQGNYTPQRRLTTPNEKQLMVLGGGFNLSKYERVFHEMAFSNQNRNLYNLESNATVSGAAWRTGVVSEKRPVKGWSDYVFDGTVTYEHNQASFSPIDRFRSVDYDWEWGYDVFSDSLQRKDQIFHMQAQVHQNATHFIKTGADYRMREGVVQGWQQHLEVAQTLGPMTVRSTNFLMNSSPERWQSRWLRSTQQVQFRLPWVQPGYALRIDRQATSFSDSVVATQMHFAAHHLFLENRDSANWRFRMEWVNREDQKPVEGQLDLFTQAQEWKVQAQTQVLRQRLQLQLNYRTVDYQQPGLEDQQNILGRLDWSGSLLKGLVRQSMNYSTVNSQELRREFVFLRVATGEGTHTWRDENGDGLQDLNEFYEAINIDEKNFVKIFTPTDEYVQAFQTIYLQTVDARLPDSWRSAGGLLSQLQKLSYNANLKYNYKTSSQAIADRLNPFATDLRSEDVRSARNLFRHTLFFNRNAPGLGGELVWLQSSNKSLLHEGFELNEGEEWLVSGRMGIGAAVVLRAKTGWGSTVHASDFLESRNFELNKWRSGGEVVWQPATVLRFIAGYEQRQKHTIDEQGSSRIGETSAEINWVRAGKGNLTAHWSWLDIQLEGMRDGLLGYELLEALQPGTNHRWRLGWQQSMNRGLQLSIQYNGRKSSGNAAVHTGTMQVTAFF